MSVTDHPQRDGWQGLARKFRKRPVMSYRPEVRHISGNVVIETAYYKHIASGLVLIAFGAGLLTLVWFKGWEFDGRMVTVPLLAGLGGLLVFGGLYFFLCRNRVWLDRGSRGFVVSYGLYPFIRHVGIPADDVEVELSINEAGISQHDRGYALLKLCRSAERVVIARSLSHEGIVEAYESIRGFLDDRGVDDTNVEIELADGSRLKVSKMPLASSTANFRTMKLAFASPEVAVIKPTLGAHIFFFAFLAFGLAGLGMLSSIADGWLPFLLCLTISSLFTIVGFLGLFGRLGQASIVFDRRRRSLTRRGSRADLFGLNGAGIALKDVGALQICAKYIEGGDPSYTAYEFNVVLCRPEGRRINLMSHAEESAVRADAEKLATFLNVPLLDHS